MFGSKQVQVYRQIQLSKQPINIKNNSFDRRRKNIQSNYLIIPIESF